MLKQSNPNIRVLYIRIFMIESKTEKEENKSKTMLIRQDKDVPFISDVLSNIPKNSNEFLRKKEQIEYEEEILFLCLDNFHRIDMNY